jgi:hypothetical protein
MNGKIFLVFLIDMKRFLSLNGGWVFPAIESVNSQGEFTLTLKQQK